MTAISTGFFAIHANHLEDLRHALVHLLKTDPLGPFEQDAVLVQSNGIAQWLKQAIAENPQAEGVGGGLGIAAGLQFMLPSEFIWSAYRSVLPADSVPKVSPFDKRRLVWRLYRLLPELVGADPRYQPLAGFLEGEDKALRSYQLAEKLADLYDQYQVYRADWLAAWERGEDRLVDARGQSSELKPEDLWQAALWRAIRIDVGVAQADSSRARVHTRFIEQGRRLSELAPATQLPRRILVFGVSSLPYQTLEALSLLSRFTQVVLCVLNPSQYYWADIVSDRDLLRAERRRGKPHALIAEQASGQLANPLLAGWGKQGRDFIRLLDEFDDPQQYRARFAADNLKIDIFSHFGPEGSTTLLHQLQNDIYNLRPLSEICAEQRTLDPNADLSLSFHSAHSPQREVEILHDQLLAAFNTDPELKPRDIMVMVPDIDRYAPFIRAVFGRHQPGSLRHIPFTVSDQGQRHQTPLLIALETLLALPRIRFSASEIVGLLEVPSVRRRFAIAEEELPQIRIWIEGANIRWGLNPAQRQTLELPLDSERNSWSAGIRAMLLGYSLGEDECWAGVEAYSEVVGIGAALAGRLAQFVDQLQRLWQALREDRTPEGWAGLISELLQQFFDESDDQDQLLLNRVRSQLELWLEDTRVAALDEQRVPLKILADLLLGSLDDSSINHRFLSGRVNFATLMPMRAIPFKRICLLGMNDGDYPRSRTPLDFDLMATDYRPGDRSRRDDDRYLFLEALLSARQQLYISWVGRSISDDSERPASVLVAQLRDHIDSHWTLAGAQSGLVSQALTCEHPLQPFSARYFPAENHGAELDQVIAARRLFTFEREWRVALHGTPAREQNPPLSFSCPTEPLSLADLGRFVKRPIDTFYQQRLQIYFDEVRNEDRDNETFELSGLERWRLEEELIRQVVIRAEDSENFAQLLQPALARMGRRGDLGIASIEQVVGQDLVASLPDLHRRYRLALQRWPESLAEPLAFDYCFEHQAGALQLSDRITGLRRNAAGEYCRLVVASARLLKGSGSNKQVRYANLLADWVIHLAGQLTDTPFTTLILGKEEQRDFTLPALPRQQARQWLEAILEAWSRGMTYPLPALSDLAYVWITSYYKSRDYPQDAERAAEQAQESFDAALQHDPGYLRASYPDFAAFTAGQQFIDPIERLYLPLWQAEQGKLDQQEDRA